MVYLSRTPGLGNMNENGDYSSCVAIMNCPSQPLSLKTNHVAKCTGDIPGQVIGINLTSSSPGVILSTMSSKHAATTARNVTRITPWGESGLECNARGFSTPNRKVAHVLTPSDRQFQTTPRTVQKQNLTLLLTPCQHCTHNIWQKGKESQ